MTLPIVAILGRPNVGKSSLFNALVRSKIAIVDPTAGVTRDRVSALMKVGKYRCLLIDTGGIGIVDKVGLAEDIEEQIQVAMHEADLLLFLVDVQAGLMPLDQEVATRLRRLKKPVMLVANKADAPMHDAEAGELYKLGLGEPFPVAAISGRGVGELREAIGPNIPEVEFEAEDSIKLAVVGATNAGKSTLVNHILGENRMIVSEVPGTTRDAVDLPFTFEGQKFTAVDTAGLRKRKSVSGTPDFYGQSRAERAIRRAHVALFLLDATKKIGRVERSVGERIQEAGRPCILVLTKWDLVPESKTLEEYESYVQEELPFLMHAPVACISAKDGFNIGETLNLAKELYGQASHRMTTGELNRVMKAAMEFKGPPVRGGRTGKIFFAAQVDVHPPTVVLFVNAARNLTPDYRRYLVKFLRERSPFPEVPIRIWLRQREQRR